MTKTETNTTVIFTLSIFLFSLFGPFFILFSALKEHAEEQRFINQEDVDKVVVEEWQLTYIDRPKYFWVSLKNDDGEVIKKTGNRKHCNKWRTHNIGDRHLFNTVYYTKPNSLNPTTTYVKVVGVAEALCGG